MEGFSGPCGPDLSFVGGLVLTSIVDGSNNSFGLSAVPDPVSSLSVYRNGILQKVAQDLTVSGNTIQFLVAPPQPGDTLLASYRVSGPDPDASQPFSGPSVICSGVGGGTNRLSPANLGSCAIPAGLLQPGDRVEIRFDALHSGTAAGFSVEVDWGVTVVAHRDASTSDVLVTGRADASILAGPTALSAQTWGTVLPFSAAVASASDAYANGLVVSFRGSVARSGDRVSLSNYTVVRIP